MRILSYIFVLDYTSTARSNTKKNLIHHARPCTHPRQPHMPFHSPTRLHAGGRGIYQCFKNRTGPPMNHFMVKPILNRSNRRLNRQTNQTVRFFTNRPSFFFPILQIFITIKRPINEPNSLPNTFKT